MGAGWNKHEDRYELIIGVGLVGAIAITLTIFFLTRDTSDAPPVDELLYGCSKSAPGNADDPSGCVLLSKKQGGKWKSKDDCTCWTCETKADGPPVAGACKFVGNEGTKQSKGECDKCGWKWGCPDSTN
jgi:hypothetical protein